MRKGCLHAMSVIFFGAPQDGVPTNGESSKMRRVDDDAYVAATPVLMKRDVAVGGEERAPAKRRTEFTAEILKRKFKNSSQILNVLKRIIDKSLKDDDSVVADLYIPDDPNVSLYESLVQSTNYPRRKRKFITNGMNLK